MPLSADFRVRSDYSDAHRPGETVDRASAPDERLETQVPETAEPGG